MALLVLVVFLSLTMLFGVVYASYFDDIPNTAMLSVSQQLTGVGDAARHICFDGHYLLFLIDLPLLVIVVARAAMRPAPMPRLLFLTSAAVAATMFFAFSATALPRPLDPLGTSYRLGFFAYEVAASFGSPVVGTASAAKARDVAAGAGR